jgi:iron complex transport system ATP-binding protein
MRARDIFVSVGEKTLLAGASVDVRPGRVVAIVGANGAGKSTLMRVVAGEIAQARGTVEMDGRPLATYAPDALARRRAVVAQHATVEADFTVLETVLLGRSPHPGHGDDEIDLAAARRALGATGMRAFEDRSYRTLSGGEKQRARLARALAQIDAGAATDVSRFLLLDEPLAGLDLAQHVAVARLLARVAKRDRVGILVVHHDLNLVAWTCDDVLVLREGRPIAQGEARATLTAEVVEEAFAVRVHRLAAPWDEEHGFLAVDPRSDGGDTWPK